MHQKNDAGSIKMKTTQMTDPCLKIYVALDYRSVKGLFMINPQNHPPKQPNLEDHPS